MSIMGNITGLAGPQPDWNQTDAVRADYIKNKPQLADPQQLSRALTLAQGALARSGGTMTGPLAMGGQQISGLAGPTEASGAATKGYVDGRAAAATLTLAPGSWDGRSQTVAVPGVTAEAWLVISPTPDSWADWCDGGIRASGQGEGTLTFTCEAVPAGELAGNLLILKGGGLL